MGVVGARTPSVTEAEEDVDAGPDGAGCGRLGAEVRDGLTADGLMTAMMFDALTERRP